MKKTTAPLLFDVPNTPPTAEQIQRVRAQAAADLERLNRSIRFWLGSAAIMFLGCVGAAISSVVAHGWMDGAYLPLIVVPVTIAGAYMLTTFDLHARPDDGTLLPGAITLLILSAALCLMASFVLGVGTTVAAATGTLAGLAIGVQHSRSSVRRADLEELLYDTDPSPKEDCVDVVEWCADPLVDRYRQRVVAERQLSNGDVIAMSRWHDGAEERAAAEQREKQVQEACRVVYATGARA